MNNRKVDGVLVNIRTQGQQAPIFCFHPVGGTIFCYLALSKHLKFDCPIYGITDPGLETNEQLFISLEEMASFYLTAIQSVQKHGPYLLAGFSMGGILAVEVARQLRNKGEELEPLILFDAWAKFSPSQFTEDAFKQKMIKRFSNTSYNDDIIELSWKRMKLLMQYKMPEIKDSIILYKAKDLLPEYANFNDKANYWTEYTKAGVVVHTIPGNHDSILHEPNVALIAEKLDSTLNHSLNTRVSVYE